MVIEAVAIDGPVASGKTSVGTRVAAMLDYAFLDTGLMYRAATWKAVGFGVDTGDESGLTKMTESMTITLSSGNGGDRLIVDGEDVTDYVVLTDARIKVFLDASVQTRAARRHSEVIASGAAIELEQVITETLRRDRIDSERAESPLRPASDAVVLDTDGLSLEEVVEHIVKLVERR